MRGNVGTERDESADEADDAIVIDKPAASYEVRTER